MLLLHFTFAACSDDDASGGGEDSPRVGPQQREEPAQQQDEQQDLQQQEQQPEQQQPQPAKGDHMDAEVRADMLPRVLARFGACKRLRACIQGAAVHPAAVAGLCACLLYTCRCLCDTCRR